MISKFENEYGTVSVDNAIIAHIAGVSAIECGGVVGMAAKNMKDGFVQLLKMENLYKGVKVRNNEDLLEIDLHLIVEYGTNISAAADDVIGTVKYKVEDTTGIFVDKVNVFVEGIRAKG